MRDTELFELCKEVYERTEWHNHISHPMSHGTPDVVPLYTSDYLLEKLPYFIKTSSGGSFQLYMMKLSNIYVSGYNKPECGKWLQLSDGSTRRFIEHQVEADTPLKALLKLVIALHDAGELK